MKLAVGMTVVMALAGSLIGTDVLLGQQRAAAAQPPGFEVTITNLTARQVFTPILVASHWPGIHLFALGSPASVELEQLAEAGDTQPLADRASGSAAVGEVVSSGAPLPPGQSVSVRVRANGRFTHVSVASMLVPTNDAFFAADAVEGPHGNHTVTLYSPAYDAGTELNDERCASIPGPPAVCQGEGFNLSRTDAEGFVHIHRGIHGINDLSAAVYDWRNPVARITIRRTP